ncbi:alanine racemase [Bordetella genomosp. 11]|uniref:Alanine racemase n=1 Tax=Bordetella genomosp. 11 TaxID=1416808 RepID=A0A261UHM2_9BORD|nr:alanine racemase [Bordetella genomosp. 11]OZI61414.1 alanine racemase [Bordetella genomosp. 11]
MPRPISVTISVSALSHNLAVVRRHLDQAAASASGADGTQWVAPSIWAVIKAHSYGHGTAQGVEGFAQADGLAMLDLAEALECRESGFARPILLLEGCFEPTDLELADRYRLTSVVHSREQLDMLAHSRPARPLDVLLKLNSGMNRLGFAPDAYRAAHARALELRDRGIVGSIGRMTHFANADGPAGVAEQLAVFQRVTGDLPGPVSISNSAATLRYPEIALARPGTASWVRPGICLYGASPFADADAASFGLKPAMSLRSRIIATQDLRAGDTVGYGSLFTADAPIRIGVVACGYADGYPRHAGTGTPVVVAGTRTRLLGRVSMDMLAVDLTPVPDAGVDAPVSLWGADGPSVDEVAQAAGTIGYELLCALAKRVPVRTVS